jgi:hypothetical protein
MAEIRVNKIDAARRQIETAIRLLFSNEDPVAIHTLVAAGCRILRDLAAKRPTAKFHQAFVELIKPGMESEAWKAINRAANFFKHADHDPNEVLTDVDEEANEALLLMSCLYYRDLGYQPTATMNAFLSWISALHPNLLRDDAPMKDLLSSPDLESLRSLRRPQQLEVGKQILKQGLMAQQNI